MHCHGQPPGFDHFVAVDWSGAKGLRHRGIALSLAEGNDAPVIVAPPHASGWARQEVAEWLLNLSGNILVAFDFSFAPPFVARGCYLPGVATADNGPAFWAWLNSRCTDADLGATSFLTTQQKHFYSGASCGVKADYMHWRVCELAFNANGGGKSSTIFDAIGAAQVAKASFAGMRLLHRLHGSFAIWPFDAPGPRTIVECYTRAMICHAGLSGRKIRDAATLATALAALGSPPPKAQNYSDHETDALVAAAALRWLASDGRWWNPVALTPEIASTEGWTFGIG